MVIQIWKSNEMIQIVENLIEQDITVKTLDQDGKPITGPAEHGKLWQEQKQKRYQ